MQKVASTRMALLQRKAQASLARQGRDLLERKRTALIREVVGLAEQAVADARALEEAAAASRLALARAEAVVGREAVTAAGNAATSQWPLDISGASVMGARVPRLLSTAGERLAPTAAPSLTVDEAAAAFRAEVEALISLAESETRLERLSSEVQRLSRQVNALDQVLIPRLRAECDQIEMDLDERERAAGYRLKLVKRALAKAD